MLRRLEKRILVNLHKCISQTDKAVGKGASTQVQAVAGAVRVSVALYITQWFVATVVHF